jgi:hypothetical protein
MPGGKKVVYTAGVMFAGTALAGTGVAAPAATAAPLPRVTNVLNGTWHLHTNDCFFGVCNYTLHLIQTGHAITSSHNTSSSFISGTVHFPHIVVNFNGVSPEDDWTCSGTINRAKTRFHGTFTDGTGGSGSCHAVRVGP